MDPQQEPTGDYGYDMAHEDVRRPTTREAPKPEPGRATPRPAPDLGQDLGHQDLGQDYGYDEAHSF